MIWYTEVKSKYQEFNAFLLATSELLALCNMSAASNRYKMKKMGPEPPYSSTIRNNKVGKIGNYPSKPDKHLEPTKQNSGVSRRQSSIPVPPTRLQTTDNMNHERPNNHSAKSTDHYRNVEVDDEGNAVETEDYSDDYDEDFEDDFESETEGSSADTYNGDDRYQNSSTSYSNSASYKDKRLNLEMQQVKQSIKEENQNKPSSKATTRAGANEPYRGQSSSAGLNRSFINFSAAKQRQSHQILAGKTRKRGDELLSMIRLGNVKTIVKCTFSHVFVFGLS